MCRCNKIKYRITKIKIKKNEIEFYKNEKKKVLLKLFPTQSFMRSFSKYIHFFIPRLITSHFLKTIQRKCVSVFMLAKSKKNKKIKKYEFLKVLNTKFFFYYLKPYKWFVILMSIFNFRNFYLFIYFFFPLFLVKIMTFSS